MGQPIILRHTYTRTRDTARAGLRYYQMRPRGEGEPPRAIFAKEGTLTRDEAYRLLDAHQARGYLAHRLMLSPPEDGRPGDLRHFTRHVLRELERDKGLALHWVAVEHRNTAHPHVHVVLCGGGERAGRVREVWLDRGDHARIKEDGQDYCRLVARVRDDWDRALDRVADAPADREHVAAGRAGATDGRAGRADDDRARG
jgi:hypothetical protein